MQDNENPLVSEIMQRVDGDDIDSIIQQAAAMTDIGPGQRSRTLVESGIAMGIQHTQAWAISFLSGQIEVIRNLLKTVDTQLVQAMGDDEQTAFLSKLREPLAANIRKYVELVIQTRAGNFQTMFGIDTAVYLSRDRGPAAMKALPVAPAFVRQHAFFGFLARTDPETAECRCQFCLTRDAYSSGKTPTELMAIAVARHGDIGEAARAFTQYILEEEWKQLDTIEASFGSTEMIDADSVGSVTSDMLAKYLTGGGRDTASHE